MNAREILEDFYNTEHELRMRKARLTLRSEDATPFRQMEAQITIDTEPEQLAHNRATIEKMLLDLEMYGRILRKAEENGFLNPEAPFRFGAER